MTKLVFIVAPDYRDPEYEDTKSALGDIETEVASTTLEDINGADGGKITPKLLIEEIKAENYDGMIIVGGPGMYHILYNYPNTTSQITDNVTAFNSDRKLVAAICIGPIALAKANILSGKKATCWNGEGKQKTEIEEAGATFTDEPVSVDGNIITGNGPAAASEFGQTIKKYFAGKDSQ